MIELNTICIEMMLQIIMIMQEAIIYGDNVYAGLIFSIMITTYTIMTIAI